MLLSGSEAIVGFPMDQVPGESFKDKKHWLLNQKKETLIAVAKKGFAVKHDSCRPVVIPSGFLLAYCSEDGATGMRWSVSSDNADNARVLGSLKMLLASHPELSGTAYGYTQFKSCLEAD